MANGISSGPNLSDVVTECGTQCLTNKTLIDPKIGSSSITFDQIATPASPSACDIKLYVDSCGKLKSLDSTGQISDVGGGIGGTDVIKVLRANDNPKADWTIGSQNSSLPNFTATTCISIFTDSSCCDALLDCLDVSSVYNIDTAACTIYDSVGITLCVPSYIRGRDVLVQFEYRTLDSSGCSADADYMVWVRDKTNSKKVTACANEAACQTILSLNEDPVALGISVGDKIWFALDCGAHETHVTAVCAAPCPTLTISDALK